VYKKCQWTLKRKQNIKFCNDNARTQPRPHNRAKLNKASANEQNVSYRPTGRIKYERAAVASNRYRREYFIYIYIYIRKRVRVIKSIPEKIRGEGRSRFFCHVKLKAFTRKNFFVFSPWRISSLLVAKVEGETKNAAKDGHDFWVRGDAIY